MQSWCRSDANVDVHALEWLDCCLLRKTLASSESCAFGVLANTASQACTLPVRHVDKLANMGRKEGGSESRLEEGFSRRDRTRRESGCKVR